VPVWCLLRGRARRDAPQYTHNADAGEFSSKPHRMFGH